MPDNELKYITTLNGSDPEYCEAGIGEWVDPTTYLSPPRHNAFAFGVMKLSAIQQTLLDDAQSVLQNLGSTQRLTRVFLCNGDSYIEM